jgi:hypothetical protein
MKIKEMTREEQITMQSLQRLERKIPDLTLRDLFAMNIINGLCANTLLSTTSLDDFATLTYKQADAMLKAREGK